eukprot:c13092_g2_i2.p1 GENE.c13092_g2_i2~~c13092_g2_i2.p1  ORF type:complete len:614 (+),score=138.75 c13092_g2_i2:62-1903(+)
MVSKTAQTWGHCACSTIILLLLIHASTCAPPLARSRFSQFEAPEAQALVMTTASTTRVPTPCESVVCSVHGICGLNVSTNSSFCKCDHSFYGPTCALTYYFEKTLEGKLNMSDTSSVGVRYVLAGEVEGVQSKEVEEVTLAVCMRLCEQELSFECAGLVFFFVGSQTIGRCSYVNKRYVTPTAESCISYVRGPETCYYGDGSGYRGSTNTTAKGHACQAWTSQSPNTHSRTPANYPIAGLDANYCRNPDGEDKPWCYTLEGDRWEYCDVPLCFDGPTPTPTPTPLPLCPTGCQLHGVCAVDTAGIYTGRCNCFPGWVPGPLHNCGQQEACPNNCSGHGACNLGECKCQPGWEGGAGDCSQASKQCTASCSGHGRCDGTTGECLCFFGWAGIACNTETYPCKNNCSGRGTCQTSDGTCICLADYMGDDCSDPLCPDECSHHGDCNGLTHMCACYPGFVGESCNMPEQVQCPNDCNGHGNCVAGRCFCNHGWSLNDCSKYLAPSCPRDCSSHGSCSDGVCDCDKHYSGLDCSVYTVPHYAPWPITAVIIPMFLVAAFLFWMVYVCYRVDVSDGRSDFFSLPIFKPLFAKREKTFKVVQGEIPGSRLKKTSYDFKD